MTESTPKVTWVCDGCGVAQATMPTAEQPKGWLRVHLSSPPRRDLSDAVRWDLCPACDKSLAAWKRYLRAALGHR